MKQLIFLFFCTFGIGYVCSQDSDVLLNHDLNHYVDRLDIKGYTGTTVHTDIKPYGRQYLGTVFAQSRTQSMSLNEQRWHTQMRMLADDSYVSDSLPQNGYFKEKKGFPKVLNRWIYTNKRDFYAYNHPNLVLYVNPVMHLMGGYELHNQGGRQGQMISVNSRGAVIRGSFMNKIGFYTEVYDNVMRVPQFIMNRTDPDGIVTRSERVNLWGETYVKRFSRSNNGLDFFSTRAYVTYSPLKAMRMKFGYDRAFWGNGFQSFFLSDNAANCLALDINTRIWKLEYTNRFSQMIDWFPGKQDILGAYPRKYGAFHQLSFKPNRNISIGLFEGVIYNSYNPNGKRGFELQYLNPIIFYRSIEQMIGSADNSVLGLTGKYNFLKHFQLYGQFLIDDFRFSEFKTGFLEGKFANKFNKTGYQIGAKYIDVLNIPTLDLQVEFNNARPYLYQHINASSNYNHYGQALGYAGGGNARDLNVMVNYHPFPQWNVQIAAMKGVKGLDIGAQNYGGNINAVYSESIPASGQGNYGYVVGFGQRVDITQLYGRLTYQILKSDIFVEAEGRYRQENTFKSVGAWIGVRFGLAPRVPKF